MRRWAGLMIFILVVTSILLGLHYYVWARLVRDPAWPRPWRLAGTIFIFSMAALLPLARLVGRRLPAGAASWALWVAFMWMGFLVFIVVTLTAMDVGQLLVRGAELAAGKRGEWLPRDPERRRFLARALAAVAGATALGTGTYAFFRAKHVRLVERAIKLARLPASMNGLTIVQITDVHVSHIIGREFVEMLVERINALSPDIIAITGDLVDGSVDDLRDAVAPLERLKSRYGTYFVTGNHEFYSGARDWRAHLGTMGIRVLSNQRVEIGSGAATIDLAGVEDPTAGQLGTAVGIALAGRDPARECVLLAHQPRSIFEASQLGVGLQISGHTHGGQIWPWRYFVYLQQPYVDGLHDHDGTQVYVSRGTGCWGPPMRFLAPPEITRFTLTRTG